MTDAGPEQPKQQSNVHEAKYYREEEYEPWRPDAEQGQPKGGLIHTQQDLQKFIYHTHPESRNNPKVFDKLWNQGSKRLNDALRQRQQEFQEEQRQKADERAQQREERQERAEKRKEEAETPHYDKEDIDMMGELFYQQGPTALQLMGSGKLSAAEKDQIRHAARVNHPDDPVKDWPRRWLEFNKGEASYARSAGTMAARVEAASNEVVQLLPQAVETSRALPRGPWVPWNTLVQKYQAGTSDPAYNDFVMANFSLQNAYTRAMNPQGIPRVNDRLEQHFNGVLSQANSGEAYQVQLRRLWKEVQASKKSVAETRKGVTGGDINAPMPGDEPEGGAPPAVPGGTPDDPLGWHK
jgi:hypothetical protein